jgi:hypothetical protein
MREPRSTSEAKTNKEIREIEDEAFEIYSEMVQSQIQSKDCSQTELYYALNTLDDANHRYYYIRPRLPSLRNSVYLKLLKDARKTRLYPIFDLAQDRIEEFLNLIPEKEEKEYYLKTLLAEMAKHGAEKTWVNFTLQKIRAEKRLFPEASATKRLPKTRSIPHSGIRIGIPQSLFAYHINQLFKEGFLQWDGSGTPWAQLGEIFLTKEGKRLDPKVMAQSLQNVINSKGSKKTRRSDRLIEEVKELTKRQE